MPLLEALNEINRRILFGRIFWGHRGVVVAMEITGIGLTPEQVSFACVQLGNLAGPPRRRAARAVRPARGRAAEATPRELGAPA